MLPTPASILLLLLLIMITIQIAVATAIAIATHFLCLTDDLLHGSFLGTIGGHKQIFQKTKSNLIQDFGSK